MTAEHDPEDDPAVARHLAEAIIARHRRRTGTNDDPPPSPDTVDGFAAELERFLAPMGHAARAEERGE